MEVSGLAWCQAPFWGPRPDFYYYDGHYSVFWIGPIELCHDLLKYWWTTVNMSFGEELFALGAWTDLVLVGCASREGGVHFSHCGGAGLCNWGCCCVLLRSTAANCFKVKVMLRPTVSRPVYLGIKHPSRASDQIFITVWRLLARWCGALSLTRGLLFKTQLITQPRHGRHRKHRSFVAVQLLLSDGMTYSIVACAAIGTDCAEDTIPVVLYGPLPRNSRLLWLRNSCFESICHSI
jgi:hypothetical protein